LVFGRHSRHGSLRRGAGRGGPLTDAGCRQLTIPAPVHEFEIALIARSGTLVGEAAEVHLVYAGAPLGVTVTLYSTRICFCRTVEVKCHHNPVIRNLANLRWPGFAN
jgi:hypothetical protein